MINSITPQEVDIKITGAKTGPKVLEFTNHAAYSMRDVIVKYRVKGSDQEHQIVIGTARFYSPVKVEFPDEHNPRAIQFTSVVGAVQRAEFPYPFTINMIPQAPAKKVVMHPRTARATFEIAAVGLLLAASSFALYWGARQQCRNNPTQNLG